MTDTVAASAAAAAAAPDAAAAASAAAAANAGTPEAIAAAAASAAAAVAAPAPTVPAIAPDAKPADAPLPATQAGDVFSYEATGNDMLDYALEFVGNQGFGPTHPAIIAAGQGNWSLLEVELARKGDKAIGYDKIISLAQKAVADAQTTADNEAKATRNLCIQEFGGTEEQFDGMMSWITAQANEGNVTKEEREDLNRMLARGGFQAKLAIQSIKTVYAQANGNIVKPAPTADNAAANLGGEVPQTWTTKTWSAYNREMRAKHGEGFVNRPEYIRARQSAAVQAGLVR